jgi:hypothetical protein
MTSERNLIVSAVGLAPSSLRELGSAPNKPGPRTPTTALNGVIPSLASIAAQKTQAQVTQKLREGTLVPLHAGGQPERQGRMPVLGYLSDADIAAAYSYLIAYPPK